jgi:hypothetical protein
MDCAVVTIRKCPYFLQTFSHAETFRLSVPLFESHSDVLVQIIEQFQQEIQMSCLYYNEQGFELCAFRGFCEMSYIYSKLSFIECMVKIVPNNIMETPQAKQMLQIVEDDETTLTPEVSPKVLLISHSEVNLKYLKYVRCINCLICCTSLGFYPCPLFRSGSIAKNTTVRLTTDVIEHQEVNNEFLLHLIFLFRRTQTFAVIYQNEKRTFH